ncbi:hypothetical protein [Streptomyces graminilatus]|uniref:hypothetical protein n=1 Tax=Streptomyces graminilatus TaxID=1464070 RepID=UPI0006E28FDF|nr:hypothetical protein [Streptomyces graminilatus]
MSSSLRRGALAASALAFSAATLAGCAAGNDAQTLQVKPDNAATTLGDIKLQNVVVITPSDPASTGPAGVAATVFNNGATAQTLESITVPGTGETAELKPATGGSLSIPAHGSLILGGANNASAVLTGNSEAVKDGNAQKITFTFSKTGAVSLRAFVVPSESYFTSWGPTEAPADTASPSAVLTPEPSPSTTPAGEAGTPAAAGGTPSVSASAAQ